MEHPSLTEAAARRVAAIAARQGRARAALRLMVDGGGCAGFQYRFELADDAGAEDLEVTNGDVSLIVDSVSLPFLEGAVVDYVENLGGAAFQVRNPAARSSCGCGTSFSV